MINFKSIKTQLIIFLVLFALYLSIVDKDLAFLFSTAVAVISAIIFDSLFVYLREKKFSIGESAIISGLIIGFVLSSDNSLWVFPAASLLAVSSKHLIRIKKKHIFNPAAFGIFLMIILFNATTQWKGTYLWYILAPVGLYFVSKIRKIGLLISYGITALGIFGVQAIIQKTPLLNIFGYLSCFFIFIMLIEPKTTPITKRGKFIFGIGAAIIIFILTELGVKFDAELCALLVLNSFTPFLNRI